MDRVENPIPRFLLAVVKRQKARQKPEGNDILAFASSIHNKQT
jgi:hypothetical protein